MLKTHVSLIAQRGLISTKGDSYQRGLKTLVVLYMYEPEILDMLNSTDVSPGSLNKNLEKHVHAGLPVTLTSIGNFPYHYEEIRTRCFQNYSRWSRTRVRRHVLPVLNRDTALGMLTTHGNPYSLATTAPGATQYSMSIHIQ